jgi:hypothetical protein
MIRDINFSASRDESADAVAAACYETSWMQQHQEHYEGGQNAPKIAKHESVKSNAFALWGICVAMSAMQARRFI